MVIRHPACNILERYIQTLLRYLRIFASNEEGLWLNYLPITKDTINHLPNTQTATSPISFYSGISPERPWSTVSTCINVEAPITSTKHKLDKIQVKKQAKIKKTSGRYSIGQLVVIKALRFSDRNKEIIGTYWLFYVESIFRYKQTSLTLQFGLYNNLQ